MQITVAETVGVEGRGGYYEKAGALRDMVQNHLFQLLALTAMEPPISFEADRGARRARQGAARDPAVHADDGARATSCAGSTPPARQGRQAVPGYREEPTVSPTSTTETFVALKLLIDNWRWADVPFYLRTGKRLDAPRLGDRDPASRTPPLLLFRDTVRRPGRAERAHRPHPAGRGHRAALPGQGARAGARASASVRMDFKYDDYFGSTPSTGYETLLYDCMTGDPTLFHRADMVETGWEVVTPMLEAWRETPDGVQPYPAVSWGPARSDAARRDGREWRTP